MTPFALALLKLAAVSLPWLALAWGLRIYPQKRLVLAALTPAVATLPLLALPGLVWLVAALDLALAAVAVIDLLTLPARKHFSAERAAVRIVSLRKPHRVTLTLWNHAARPQTVWVRDGVPHELQVCSETGTDSEPVGTPRGTTRGGEVPVPFSEQTVAAKPAEFALLLGPRSRVAMHYVLRPSRRGAFTIDQVHLRAGSRWGLWQRMLRLPLETVLHVYPDMQQLSQYAMLARTDRLSLLGVRRARRIGQDHDFERLRDYTPDDNYKHIDWRATARRRRLTVKEFQSTQAQRLIFLIDCGRMMTNEAAGLSLLDHAMNALLMLSYVALRQGDAVGMIAFSDEIHGFVPPRSGMHQMNRLLHACFDRFPRLVESRYDQAFRYLAAHCRKRSLVVLVTNVIDEVTSHQIHRYLSHLVGRHLPLGVLLRDRRLFEAADADQPQGDRFWQAAAAAEILSWRRQVLTDLERQGVLSLDVFPEALTAPLVNRYLEIKARHLL